MTWEIVFTLFFIGLMLIGLIFEIASPFIVIFFTLTIFVITGIVSIEEALSGFANEALWTIAMLFIIAGTIKKSGIIDQIISRLLQRQGTVKKTLLKLLPPIAGLSAFLNNTPIVITLTPILRDWCEKNNIPPSKLLIPLSYATILGGTITLMGTSTNLIIHELMIENGLQGFSIFTPLAIVGIPITVLGIGYLICIGHKFLPSHKPIKDTVAEQSREYLGEVVIEKNFPFTYLTIDDAGLRNLKGIYFISLLRGKKRITPLKSTTIVQPGDRLTFTGDLSSIAELQSIKGLQIETNSDMDISDLCNNHTNFVEAVVSHHSTLLYQKLKDTQFRAKYDAVVIAVHRKNERIHSKIGDIILKPGDTLLMLTGSDFQKNSGKDDDFYVVTPVKRTSYTKSNSKRGWFAIAIFLAMITLVTFQILSMFMALLITISCFFLFRMFKPSEAKHYIQLHVLMIIACSLGVGKALTNSGTAQWVADKLLYLTEPFGVLMILISVYFITIMFTEFITNNAAAVLMFPIAMEISNVVSLDPLVLAVIVAIAASASFATPIGYQTNLIVYGPGGYSFKDFLKAGIPLNMMTMIATVTIVYLFWV